MCAGFRKFSRFLNYFVLAKIATSSARVKTAYYTAVVPQGLDGFQKSLLPCALDKSSPSIGRVKCLSQRYLPNL